MNAFVSIEKKSHENGTCQVVLYMHIVTDGDVVFIQAPTDDPVTRLITGTNMSTVNERWTVKIELRLVMTRFD